MKRPHFALPEIYGEPLSFYEILSKLRRLLNDETDDRKNTDAELQRNINTEASAREQADTALHNGLTTETKAREQADTTLQRNINAETSARQQADTTLQRNINTEVSAREQADNELRELIRESSGGVIGVTEAQLQEEVTARQQADTALQTNIDNEVTARQQADTALQTNIDNEVMARQQADTALQTNIDNIKKQIGNIKFVYQSNVPVHFTNSRKSDALTPPENAVAILSVNGEPPWQAWTYAFYNNQFKIICVDKVQFDRSFNMNILWACSQ